MLESIKRVQCACSNWICISKSDLASFGYYGCDASVIVAWTCAIYTGDGDIGGTDPSTIGKAVVIYLPIHKYTNKQIWYSDIW